MVEVGESIPRAKLFDTELQPVSLAKAVKSGTTVIAFFPGAFTGVCTKELCTFRDDLAKFDGLNARILAVSVDGPFANKAFKEKHSIGFPILSDYRRKAVRAFGIELKDFAGLKGYTAAKRAVFIATPDGIVRYKWVTDDPTVEPDYAAIRAALSGIA